MPRAARAAPAPVRLPGGPHLAQGPVDVAELLRHLRHVGADAEREVEIGRHGAYIEDMREILWFIGLIMAPAAVMFAGLLLFILLAALIAPFLG